MRRYRRAIYALAVAVAARCARLAIARRAGLLEAMRQLQGFEAPANSWERQIFARRVAGYTPEMLDHLCLTGAVGWGRLSPHPATLETWSREGRRVIPTSVAPIAFFVREDADWMMPPGARRERNPRSKA